MKSNTMKTNALTYGATGGNFLYKLALIQISVVLQLVMNTCGLEEAKAYMTII